MRHRRAKQPVNARMIRKVQRIADPLVVNPTKMEENDLGYTSDAIVTKNFTSYVKLLAPNAVEPMVCHPKKVRAYRCLSGEGFFFFKDNDSDDIKTKRLKAGDQFICEPGMTYRLGTVGDQHLELQVIEDSKYEARLEILAPAEAPLSKDIPTFTEPGQPVQATLDQKKEYSKKAAQQAKKAAQRRAADKGDVSAIVAGSGGGLPEGFKPEKINAAPTIPR